MLFFFQAEDGIRDIGVTGVQTCALPIFVREPPPDRKMLDRVVRAQIGLAEETVVVHKAAVGSRLWAIGNMDCVPAARSVDDAVVCGTSQAGAESPKPKAQSPSRSSIPLRHDLDPSLCGSSAGRVFEPAVR